MTKEMLSLSKTAMQAIYEGTCLEIIKELGSNLAEDKITKESFTSLNGIDKSVQEINFTKGIHDLYKKYHNPDIKLSKTNKEVILLTSFKKFNKDIDIMKLGEHNMSIDEAMEIAGNLYKEVGSRFYGMLLSSKGDRKKRIMFNPLHPIIVAELKKEESSFDTTAKEWSISVYSFKDNVKSYYDNLRNNEDYIHEIATVVASINSPANYITENKNFKVDIVNDKFVLNYEEIKRLRSNDEIVNEENGDRNYIIPSQIINILGVAYPYYGVTYSRKGLAWNLSPMYAANINHPRGQSMGGGMEGGSRICTHSGNSNTQKGLSALNHCNTTSPLNSYIMTEGSITYAEQSLRASLEMFLGDKFTTDDGKEKVLTYKEFIEENNGNGTKKQYLEYIKNRLSQKMDGEPDKVVVQPIDPKIDYNPPTHKVIRAGEKYPRYVAAAYNNKLYKRGDITLDSDGTEPQVFIGYDAKDENKNYQEWLDIYTDEAKAIINEKYTADTYGTGTNRVDPYGNRQLEPIPETDEDDPFTEPINETPIE